MQFGPVELPSGKKVFFREPKNSDRRALLEGFGGDELRERNGKLEEALAYTCLTKLDDKNVEDMTYNLKSDLFSIKDGQFYQALFLNMFSIGKDEVEQIQALSKKLLGTGTGVS